MKSRHAAGRQVPGRHAPDPSRAGKPAVSPESAAVGATSRPPRPSTEMSSRMKETPVSMRQGESVKARCWKRPLALLLGLAPLTVLLAAGCNNNPYPPEEAHRPILYRAIIDDPKRLDPSISYTV